MSIATELTLLANSKQAIKASINAKGGSVTDSTPFADYSTAIDNLPSGGSGNPLLTSIDVSDFTGTTFNDAKSYITDVTIPSGVTSIGQNAFYGCSSLTSITIPSGVTSIGQNAFYGCSSLTSITIPSGVTSIGESVFSRDFDIATACVDENNTKYYSPNDCDGIIDRTTNTLILATNGMTVPSTVTKVASGAINTTSMYIIKFLGTTPPNFSGGAVNNKVYGERAYAYVPEESVSAYQAAYNLPQYSYIDYERPAIIQNGETLLNSDIYSYSGIFTYDTSRTLSGDVKLTDYITRIQTSGGYPYTRNMKNITSFDFNENPSFTVLVNYQFENCTSLKTLVLSSYITKLNFHSLPENLEILTCRAVTPPTYDVRVDMPNLQAIYVPAESVDTYKAASGWSTYADRIQAIPEDVKPAFKFTSSVDSSKNITVNCEDMETAGTLTANDLGMSSQQIDEFRLAENTGSVEIGDCVKIYMAAACYTAKGISEVKLNEGLERIGDFAFGGMSALTEITIPSTVTNISYQAFYADRALEGITCFATTPPTLGSDVFGDTNNCPIYVPAESVDTYKTAWPQYADRIQAIPAE